MNALLDFLRALVKTNIPIFSANQLLAMFLGPEKTTQKIDSSASHKQSYYSLAKCISVVSVGSGKTQEALAVANTFVTELSNASKGNLSDAQIIIALLSIGEIGRHV